MQHFASSPQCDALKDVVRYFWQVDRYNIEFNRETIIPKGNVEVIFNLYDSGSVQAKIGNADYSIPRCFISGFNTLPIEFHIPERQIFFGVCFNPTALRKVFPIHADDYANQCVDLALVDKSVGSLWNQLGDQRTFDERMSVFNGWMKDRLPDISKHEKLFDSFLCKALSDINSADEASDMLYYSPRHLSRKLHDLSGMNLEQTLVYRRYLSATNLIHNSELSLTEISHNCKFSDQSHFSKTFRSFAGMSPRVYRSRKSKISGHIFENVR